MFAPEIGRMAGITVPIIPFSHQYLVTEPIEGVTPDLPQLRDPDNLVYFRPEVRGLVMGGYERDPAAWSLDGIPPDFNGKLLPEDWPRFEEISAGAVRRVPAMHDAGITRLINGPEGFTPDNEFILGESEVRGLFVAAGFSAHGIAGAGGLARQMAQWIVDGEPELDLWKMDIRRFGAQYRSRAYTLARATENYATYYDIHYPNEERQLGPAAAPLPDLRAADGARLRVRREVGLGASQLVRVERRRRRRGAAPARLGRAALVAGDRRRVARHPERGRALRRDQLRQDRDQWDRRAHLPAAPVRQRDGSPGRRITYTQMLNRRGGIECDFTVTRLAEDRFFIVTGTAFGNHDLGWIRKHAPDDGSVTVSDVTSSRACIGIWGPVGSPDRAVDDRPMTSATRPSPT